MTIKQHAYTVGQATVTRIQELTLANITPAALFPDWDAGVLADHPDWLPSEAMDESREHILLSVHSWLIQESGRTILIDTGAGNGKKRPYAPYFDGLNNPFLERLRAVGVAPGHRLRPAHPPSRRSCGLEHAAGRGKLGTYVSQSPVYIFPR